MSLFAGDHMRLGLCFGTDRLQQTAFEHVRGSCFRRGVGKLADEQARFFEGFGAVRAAGRKMRLKRGALFGIERAESVAFH